MLTVRHSVDTGTGGRMNEDEAQQFVEDVLLGLSRIQSDEWTEEDIHRWMVFDQCA